ncbi:pentatricopeptide repeat-containing protein At4g04790, mitochondrial-like [Dioscorea cayenensis subsp. rotundata]|uniref:Pentatricopeptide repeat-containing protein At4g04790, mitochondrial-like n=1 Tax=Dioscorea cayennensis subsp. rotundata TaxID=55577 RepID=A0AB40BX97_DIOCR|nr:pentatricopeptide repeat-containing protein At4g04790, mitochondrial-like [Dioscorea cayenensis subsp. rotundata]
MPRTLIKVFLFSPNPFATPNASIPLNLSAPKNLIHTSPPCLPASAASAAALDPSKPSVEVPSQHVSRLNTAELDSAVGISREISSILRGNNDASSQPLPLHSDVLPKNILGIPWFSNKSHSHPSQRRKEVSRERKQRYIFKNTESRRFTKLMRMCANKLGTESTLEIFGKLGRETGVREYNALIKVCIGNARLSNAEEDSLGYIHEAYQLIMSMRERGFQIDEDSYGPILMYTIDKGLIQEFKFFSKLIKDECPGSSCRMCYYETLLWIKVGYEDKIHELCNHAGVAIKNYLLAFGENDRKAEFLQLLKVLDIRKISSPKYIASIFKFLGRWKLDNFSEKFIFALKAAEVGDENISSFIYDYVVNVPNLAVEELLPKLNNLHEKLGVVLCIASYEKLIGLCCELFKVDAALIIADHMCHSGFNIPIETLHPILRATEEGGELDLVHSIHSVMCRHSLKPKEDTLKSMISLYVKIKDFAGAYNLLRSVQEMNQPLTTSMFNAIMAGHFREKNYYGALMVLKQMEEADVKPDSETFSYLISNCKCENDIIKYQKDLQNSGVLLSKHIYMALINAYANLGKFDMAKKVILDKDVPARYLNELKSVLVSALASNGQILDALKVYDEIKRVGGSLEPKAVISLIEYLQHEGELDRLLQLIQELKDSKSWFDGCSRVILYCTRYNLGSSAIDLLKSLMKADESSTYIIIDQIFSQIWEMEPTNIGIGLELLQAMKEELHLHPSRTCLDFLLSSCVKAKNPQCVRMVWSEYEKAGLPYNILTYLRMYQVLLASGEYEAAAKMLKKIPQDDPHIRYVVKSCRTSFS